MSTNPKLCAVVAMDRNRTIGKDGDLPWRLPSDLKHFKRVTLGKPCLMGRKTWESLPFPLPGRPNLVLTRNADYAAQGAEVFTDMNSMIREGYELAISRPQVINKEIDGVLCEPWENLTVDVEADHQGSVMEKLGARKGNLKDMIPDGQGRVRLDYEIPTRGLIGFRSDFLTTTSGTGLMYHNFDRYAPRVAAGIGRRAKGVLIAKYTGTAVDKFGSEISINSTPCSLSNSTV